ncbi:uncharacterized protein C21orf62-like [Notolabrus celidotus]|uniref:uncharacterized protein C21orf62-like n=1 Tax=Notolabrus celidotus TaxID=1203425 RepID=UPI00148FEC59|nr:uncharacterized protein C21orf62-like [Notolabrus celidotus]
MEMSPHTLSSAWLLWSLWWLFFLTRPSEASPPLNTTLLFDSGAPGFSLRNCSCSAPIRDCNEALANSVCRCHTVLRSALPPAGLRERGVLTVWVKELWVLQEVLNRSTVAHLRLSFCGERPIHSQYLSLLGLQTLRVNSPHAPYPTQDISITPPADFNTPAESPSPSPSDHVTFLDMSVLNGLSALKAYSVLGPPPHTFSQHFPHLHLPPAPSESYAPEDRATENLLLTFIY